MNALINFIFVIVVIAGLVMALNFLLSIFLGSYYIFIPRAHRKKDFSFFGEYVLYTSIPLLALFVVGLQIINKFG
ncbi:hypothetical protein [Mammaliicoccus sp. F-M27]|uniref:hypothetical protein n=1 Tax=Mammaliicoccus sp. F-M27 TaxID=2898687 RepID=UPI001EFB311F|nr:hypothetical protein [Mammaliicoccus sp. F-M27]